MSDIANVEFKGLPGWLRALMKAYPALHAGWMRHCERLVEQDGEIARLKEQLGLQRHSALLTDEQISSKVADGYHEGYRKGLADYELEPQLPAVQRARDQMQAERDSARRNVQEWEIKFHAAMTMNKAILAHGDGMALLKACEDVRALEQKLARAKLFMETL